MMRNVSYYEAIKSNVRTKTSISSQRNVCDKMVSVVSAEEKAEL